MFDLDITPERKQHGSEIDFTSIVLGIASPEDILDQSHGEVVKPETINYRTQKPEMGGLFCERIFGPVKNWECACGKYKRIRYKGVVCEKCGVEVTRSIVRRERMGHINLAVPVAHSWFIRTLPSRIGLLLDLGVKDIEKIIYFAAYVVTQVDASERDKSVEELDSEFKALRKRTQAEGQEEINKLKADALAGTATAKDVEHAELELIAKLDELDVQLGELRRKLRSLERGTILSEVEYRALSLRFGHTFRAGSGAEALYDMMSSVDLRTLIETKTEALNAPGGDKKKLHKIVKLATELLNANIEPKWMVMTVLPVLPADLRPMVALEGGRFAASDLNDLYRRVINRNNRLKRLIKLGAPDVITRNEKRMLQEAVDSLISGEERRQSGNFRGGNRRPLKSLSDMLKGKKGRFRQNLLGKRVDYSGRSVIVAGPRLKLHQCGLPKKIALKLFKPFVIARLIHDDLAHNVKSAERYIGEGHKQVWDILEEVVSNRCVLLNRAPTLHRLGIQAFFPVLIDGLAIQIHPLVTTAFNADFDGDQMAVHLPLSEAAQEEARTLMLSANNLLKPSSGDPVINPSQDLVLGIYYLTNTHAGKKGEGSVFGSRDEAIMAYDQGKVHLQASIRVRLDDKFVTTTVGRLFFNAVLHPSLGFVNTKVGKKELQRIFSHYFFEIGTAETAAMADEVKELGYRYVTASGLSVGKEDMRLPAEKEGVREQAAEIVKKLNNQYWRGIITEEERYQQVVKVWHKFKADVSAMMKKGFAEENHIFYQVDSGARGNWEQITQLCGTKGLVASPSGKTIELPVVSSLKEGFTVLEYFIATHGGRKGKADTALKTANAGYLTRKLVDISQEVVVTHEDCGTELFIVVGGSTSAFDNKISKKVIGRTAAADVIHPTTGEVLAAKGTLMTHKLADAIEAAGVKEVAIYSPLTCESRHGICAKCYGMDMGHAIPVEIGSPVGIIAAQSIGEPGTQLTMRSFHSGGVAMEGVEISQGLTRVEELFEARTPKFTAFMAEAEGKVDVNKEDNKYILTIAGDEDGAETMDLPKGAKVLVAIGDTVRKGQTLYEVAGEQFKAREPGRIEKITASRISISRVDKKPRTYEIPTIYTLLVKDGDHVEFGQALTNGHYDLRKLMALRGVTATQKYIVNEIQEVYNSQGQSINDKHVEVIVRKMFSKVQIAEPGDSGLLSGDIVDILEIDRLNSGLTENNMRPATYVRQLLGLTKAALATGSWLAAASFQETIRTLVGVSVSRRPDHLRGLKENVIIGRLIPVGKHLHDVPAAADDEVVAISADSM